MAVAAVFNICSFARTAPVSRACQVSNAHYNAAGSIVVCVQHASNYVNSLGSYMSFDVRNPLTRTQCAMTDEEYQRLREDPTLTALVPMEQIQDIVERPSGGTQGGLLGKVFKYQTNDQQNSERLVVVESPSPDGTYRVSDWFLTSQRSLPGTPLPFQGRIHSEPMDKESDSAENEPMPSGQAKANDECATGEDCA